MINFNEDKISINNCIKHNNIKYSINEFMKNQFIELKCYACKNNKYLYNDIFYLCSCNQYICPLCAISHDKSHIMIEYNNRFKKCVKHDEYYILYCVSCKNNLCFKCEENHCHNHKMISFKSKIPQEKKMKEIKNEIEEIERKIKKYKKEIILLNNFYLTNMNNIIKDLDNYILFYEKIGKSI